jgi:hypothetical protein
MEHKPIAMSVIAPVVVAGVLILAVLIAIPSNALMTHSSSEYEKCLKSSKNCFLLNNKSSNTGKGATSQESSNTGKGATSQESSAGNAAQEGSNTGQSSRSSQISGGTVAQEGPSGQGGHCKAAVTSLSASWYPPYSNYMIRGQLTCGGSGLSGKTITLTSSKLSYVGAFGTAKTREDGSFSASTRKPLTTVSAWYLGGPDEGGIASKVVTPHGGPQSSNTASTPQESSNTGNGATSQKSSNTGNGRTNIFAPTGTCNNCFGLNSPQKQESSNTVAQGGPSGGNVVQGTPQKSSESGNAAQEKGGTIKVKCTNGYALDSSSSVFVHSLLWNACHLPEKCST